MGLRSLWKGWKFWRAWSSLRDEWRREMAMPGFSWAVNVWKGVKVALMTLLGVAVAAAVPPVLELLTDAEWLAEHLELSPGLEATLIVLVAMLARMLQNWLQNREMQVESSRTLRD